MVYRESAIFDSAQQQKRKMGGFFVCEGATVHVSINRVETCTLGCMGPTLSQR